MWLKQVVVSHVGNCIEHQEALLLEGFFSEGDTVFEGVELWTISTKNKQKKIHNTDWYHYCCVVFFSTNLTRSLFVGIIIVLHARKGRSVLSIWIFKWLFSNIAIQVSAHSLLDVFVFLLSGLVSVLEYIMFMLIFLFWVTARITSNVLPVQSEMLCLSSCLFKAPPLPPNTFWLVSSHMPD